jgi:hypothetical protein
MFCASDPNLVVMDGPNSNINYQLNYQFNNISSMFRSQERIKKIQKIYGEIQKEEVRF